MVVFLGEACFPRQTDWKCRVVPRVRFADRIDWGYFCGDKTEWERFFSFFCDKLELERFSNVPVLSFRFADNSNIL